MLPNYENCLDYEKKPKTTDFQSQKQVKTAGFLFYKKKHKESQGGCRILFIETCVVAENNNLEKWSGGKEN